MITCFFKLKGNSTTRARDIPVVAASSRTMEGLDGVKRKG